MHKDPTEPSTSQPPNAEQAPATEDSKTPAYERSTSLHTFIGRLTHMLHDLDPMGTCCRLNLDMEDEYAPEAWRIARLLDSGVPLHDAVCQVFDEWFWEDCLKNRVGYQGLNTLIARLDKGLAQLSNHHDMPALHERLFHRILPDLSIDDLGWSYATFMQTAPEQLDPAALDGEPTARAGLIEISLDDPEDEDIDSEPASDTDQSVIPRPNEPDPTNALPWLHALLFEKTHRRALPEHLLSYPQFLQQVRHRLKA